MKHKNVPAWAVWLLALIVVAMGGFGIGRMELWKLSRIKTLLGRDSLYHPPGIRMIEGAAGGMADSVNDPYTNYLDNQQMQSLITRLQADMSPGFGLELTPCTIGLYVSDVLDTGPAQIGGIARGDIILTVNGYSTLTHAHLLSNVQAGMRVTLKISRNGGIRSERLVAATLAPFPDVYGDMAAQGVGYIRLRSFVQPDTGYAVRSLLQQMGEMDALIFDVRGNPGGRLDAALAIAGCFVEEGLLLLNLVDGRGNTTPYLSAGNMYLDMPLIVLTDGQSASAAEVLAGILRDLAGAKLVGAQTYGKGLVQSIHQLGDGSGLRYTSAEYVLPSGARPQQEGLVPDLAVDEGPIAGWALAHGADAPLQAALGLLAQ